MFTNISQSKGSQAMTFHQLIAYSEENFSLKNYLENKAVPD